MDIRIPSQLPCSLTRTKHIPFPLHLSYSSPSFSLCRASIRTTSKSPLPSFRTSCIRPIRGNADAELDSSLPTFDTANDASAPSFSSDELSGAKSATIWRQVKEIVRFAGPATGLWICGPLMGLIDTVVLGRSSSLELAALGPGTVVCDNTSYAFMFLSIATSNMVATARAKKDNNLLQHQISMLLFIALTCGLGMLFLMKFMGVKIIAAFTGPKNLHMVPAANTYVQPSMLFGARCLKGWKQSSPLGRLGIYLLEEESLS
ncbi:protein DETOXIFICATION 46, chloroplastic [Cinnamomum micranthum f. kanehirae]|uniref:Protein DETOXIFICATION 46, chloroplastic n=1 Tax=Cinnamomum micranthum f. kanehirae TaxID=337451 RepID=A0A3S3NHB5_9MAGN|nr:protein DETOXIFICATION 46, chloroplastic [Cinnamomum micranthum f. kanehirae]